MTNPKTKTETQPQTQPEAKSETLPLFDPNQSYPKNSIGHFLKEILDFTHDPESKLTTESPLRFFESELDPSFELSPMDFHAFRTESSPEGSPRALGLVMVPAELAKLQRALSLLKDLQAKLKGKPAESTNPASEEPPCSDLH